MNKIAISILAFLTLVFPEAACATSTATANSPKTEADAKTASSTDPAPKPDNIAAWSKCEFGAVVYPNGILLRCLSEAEMAQLGKQVHSNEPISKAESKNDSPTEKPTEAPSSGRIQLTAAAAEFENGSIEDLEKEKTKIWKWMLSEFTKCVEQNGSLGSAKQGSFQVQFLVRDQGKAEGVEVSNAKSLKPEATSCIRLALKNKRVGLPTGDPVGVKIKFTVKTEVK